MIISRVATPGEGQRDIDGVPTGCTLAEFIGMQGREYADRYVCLNGRTIDKPFLSTTVLQSGDEVSFLSPLKAA